MARAWLRLGTAAVLALVGVAATGAAAQTGDAGAAPNPGQAATDRVISPTKPPGEIADPIDTRRAAPMPGTASPGGALGPAEIRALLDHSAETAKATREAVDYGRVVPDILTQILTKLDKIEDKLGRIEDSLKAPAGRRR